MNSTPAPKSAGLPIAAVLLVALAAGLGLWAGQRWMAAPASLKMQTVVLYPEPRELPAFELDGADGRIDAAALRGRWTLVFLGFTHCPDICPTTLADLARVQKLLADVPAAQRPRILFVSADPERDSAKSTTDYARFFSPDALGATADQARLEPFARSLYMVYMKAERPDGDYTIDHSPHIALLDPQARSAGVIKPPLDAAKIAADLRTLGAR
jgi:protein SCO1